MWLLYWVENYHLLVESLGRAQYNTDMPTIIENQQAVVEALQQLAHRVNTEVDKALERQMIKPEEEILKRRKVKRFLYTPRGIQRYIFEWEYETSLSWQKAVRKVQEGVKRSEEFLSVRRMNPARQGKGFPVQLDTFVEHVITQRLNNSRLNSPDIELLTKQFLDDISGEEVFYHCRVLLEGLILAVDEIKFRSEEGVYSIRQTRPEDLDPCLYCETLAKHERFPTAVLEFEATFSDPALIKDRIDRAIAILRLFKAAGVQCFCCHGEADSILHKFPMGVVHSQLNYRPVEKGLVTAEDAERLKRFWAKVSVEIPAAFYQAVKESPTPSQIAYQRYYTALLQEGSFERRVAQTVMGLEGIFLRSRGKDEAAFRLSFRAAKVMAAFGFDAYQARDILEDAYLIQRTFGHGELLAAREKKKILKKYKGQNFIGILLNYLRLSILIMLTAFKEKEGFLQLIDDAAIDRVKDTQLLNLIQSARKNF